MVDAWTSGRLSICKLESSAEPTGDLGDVAATSSIAVTAM
jgi:hypothetical protein